MNSQRFRHPLFAIPGLHEDDIAPGMRGFRWRKEPGRGRRGGNEYSLLKKQKPHTIRRPVTVTEVRKALCPVTIMEKRAQPRLPAVNAPSVVGDTTVFFKTNEAINWIVGVQVMDEETAIPLDFMRDPPYRNTAGEMMPAPLSFHDGPHEWKLKLGIFRNGLCSTCIFRRRRAPCSRLSRARS